jgi:hypothetical protein
MLAVWFRNLWLGLVIAVALAVLAPTIASAYTPEEQQACSGDAMRLCGDFIPDVDRITVCMIQKKAQLSPGCRVYFRSPEPEPSVEAGRPMSIKPATARKPASTKSKKVKKPAKPADT